MFYQPANFFNCWYFIIYWRKSQNDIFLYCENCYSLNCAVYVRFYTVRQ